MLFYSGNILVDPSNADVIEELGMTIRPSSTSCDVLVLGAGPAGLATAVYAASERLHTMVVEPEVPGGQAGTSSLIRNYLGFRHCVSGERSRGPSHARRDVVVVGSGNSAVHAAVHLARYARSVTMLVRDTVLAATMSKYLITEITSNPPSPYGRERRLSMAPDQGALRPLP